MASQHLTMRLDPETFRRLEAHRRQWGTSRSEVGRTLLEEGLRMEEHPGIVFRNGLGGRRAGLSGGPDVWEVARVFRTAGSAGLSGDDAVQRACEALDLTLEQARCALHYYATFTAEVDAWIERVDEEAARAEAAWLKEQALLAR